MNVIESLRCGVTFGGAGCNASWLSSVTSGLIVLGGSFLVLFGLLFLGRRWGRNQPAGQARGAEEPASSLVRNAPFPYVTHDADGHLRRTRLDSQPVLYAGMNGGSTQPIPVLLRSSLVGVAKPGTDMAGRLLCPSIVVRTGPAVVITGEPRLASVTAPIVAAQGSAALWWDPSGVAKQPAHTQLAGWDPLGGIIDADAALGFARELLGSARLAASLGGPIERQAVHVLGSLLLAARFSSGSAAQTGTWLTWGPGSWDAAVAALDGNAEKSAWPLAAELDVAIRTAGEWLDPDVEEVFRVVAGALDAMVPLDEIRRRPLLLRPFVSGGSDVLFVVLPPPETLPTSNGTAAAVAASMLVGRIIRLHRHLFRSAAPLSVLLDDPDGSLAIPHPSQLFPPGPDPLMIWASIASHPRRIAPRATARIRVRGGGRVGGVLDSEQERYQVALPRFSEPPWSAVSAAARGVLGKSAIRQSRTSTGGPSTLVESNDRPR